MFKTRRAQPKASQHTRFKLVGVLCKQPNQHKLLRKGCLSAKGKKKERNPLHLQSTSLEIHPGLIPWNKDMTTTVLQTVGLILGGIGVVGTFAITGMPQWRVTAFIENNIVVFETIWEGLWMNCIRHADIRMQCKVYDSLLALPPDLQASRGLMCTASALAFIAFAVAVLGMKCMQCTGNDDQIKGYILLAGGIAFIVAGIIVFIPVSWVAHNIIRDFYNPLVTAAQKRELGEALYIGWTSASCLIAGGAVLCCFCHCNEKTATYRYTMPSQQTAYHSQHVQRRPGSAYSKSQYV